MRSKLFLSVIFISLLALRVSAIRYYVNASVEDGGDGLSWATAFSSPTEAFAVTNTGDDVWIARGSYFPGNGVVRNSPFTIEDGISVYGGFSGTETALNQRNFIDNRTILTGEIGSPAIEDNVFSVLQINAVDIDVLLDGIIIERGYNDLDIAWAGGLTLRRAGQVTIRNCIIRQNESALSSASGGGLVIPDVSINSLLIENCVFDSNKTVGQNARGGALGLALFSVSLDFDITIRRSTFLNNSAERDGGALFLAGPQSGHTNLVNVQSCIFANNFSGVSGSAIFAQQNLRVEHCSFTNNENSSNLAASAAISKFSGYSNDFHVYNSVFLGNVPQDVPTSILGVASPNSILDNNQFESQVFPGNTVASALFVNAAAGDLRLRPNSPGVNEGDPAFTSTPLDHYGNSRVAMGAPDLGAHEVQNMNKPIIYVKKDNDLIGTGTSWASALPELNQVDFDNTSDVQVWIAEGTYHPTYADIDGVRFNLSANVDLIGGFTGNENSISQANADNETILSGKSGDLTTMARTRTVINMLSTGSHTLENLVIQDAGESSSHIGDLYGPISGAYLDALQIRNCTIRNNESDFSAGAIETLQVADLNISGSTFEDNRCSLGASGIYCYESTTLIEDCSFIGGNPNFVPVGSSAAVLFINSSAEVNNCVFEGNRSNNGAAAIDAIGPDGVGALNPPVFVEVRNCSFTNNSSTRSDDQTSIVYGRPSVLLNMINCLLARNTSNAILRANGPEVVLVGSTIAENTLLDGGYAARLGGGPDTTALSMHNTILWNPGGDERLYRGPITLSVTHNLIRNEFFPPDNPNSILNTDPEFVNPAGGDYRLRPWSPALEAGDNQFTSPLESDLAGNGRIFGANVDIGAYERQGDCTPDNGVCDSAEIIDLGVSINGANLCGSSGSDPISSCNVNVGKTVWYAFEAPASGTVEITTSGIVPSNGFTNFNMKQTVYSGDCADLEEVACTNIEGPNVGEVSLLDGLTAEQVYYVRLEGVNLQEAFFTLIIEDQGTNCPGDFNFDGVRNTADLLFLLAENGCTEGCTADLNGDGLVNTGDLTSFLANFGSVCE